MLKQTVEEQIKVALKAGETLRLSTLRLLLSAINNEEIAKQKELSEEEIIAVVQHQAKQRKEAIEAYEKGGREELAAKERQELEILNKFLPQQLSEEEVKKIVLEVVAGLSDDDKKNFGKIMGSAMTRLKGQTEGNIVSKVVKEILAE
ncbi:glutamyl-tRNA amidotransferase [Candidatus Shapirobacteria bacterium CG03_land_8_20_14_0_80_39_12]|uniref:Glutamyl-tRNA amidotransferase n=1 Tax=Candidatus Shapirobacteria bacterium CG03_land_8_20_14_0_80_39_12 TaxID=1974879 RepID=A0A2M7BEG1_9BACT|nr:MAG: glutamyl-tRNA amidotransferase [Candidatus Shapirobacteria bacterium CG03_land_8_20_14_0_80_39_12]